MNELVTIVGLLVAFGGLVVLGFLFLHLGPSDLPDPRGDLATRLAVKHARRAKSHGPYGGPRP